MPIFSTRTTTSDEAQGLVRAMRNISVAILDEAEALAWREHEAGKLSDSHYFVVCRRLRLLAGLTNTPMGKEATGGK